MVQGINWSRRAYNAANTIGQAYRRYSRLKQRRFSAGRGVTNQYDRTNVYRKKRMPAKKRRRWKKFVQKVRAVENSTLGTRTRVYNQRIEIQQGSGGTGSVTAKQLCRSVCLYGNNDRSASDLAITRRDLNNIVMSDSDIQKSGKIQMASGIFDMTLQNRSVDATGSEMGVELDVYLITARKRFQYKDSTTPGNYSNTTLEGVLAESANVMDPLATATTYKITDMGTTPFDFTSALSSFGIKIHSKKKYFLPYGNTMTYQIRDPKNRQFMKDAVDDVGGSNYPGSTKHLLLIAKGLPGSSTNPGDGIPNVYSVNLALGLTRKYAYKINESDGDKAGGA